MIAAVFSAFLLQAQELDECTSFGWANFDGQTKSDPVSGGGKVAPVEVTTFAALKSAVESSDARVIHVMNDVGNGYVGKTGDVLYFKSNKTVIGVKPGITVKCSFQVKNATNVIIRNLIIMGPGNSNSNQNWDAVTIEGTSKRIWFDHCTVMEGEDGNFDVVKGADNVTASWCKFTYVTGGEHNLSNLVGSSDNESQSHGKLNITYAYCWWDNVHSRCPRTRYGKIHVLNSYYNNVGDAAFAGFMSNIRVEACYFENNVGNPTGLISTNGQAGVFTIDCNRGATKTDGYTTVFTPPYEYKKYNNSEVKNLVTKQAGPTLTDPTKCGITSIAAQSGHDTPATTASSLYVKDNVTITLNLKQGDELRMSLLDLTGRSVVAMNKKNTGTGSITSSMNVKHVKPGVYLFKVRFGDRVITQQIVKN